MAARRCEHTPRLRAAWLFQSTRDHEWPRDTCWSACSAALSSAFNPRATTNGRATLRRRADAHCERRFQSTRDHEWPRDRGHSQAASATHGFNPRATTNGRATRPRRRIPRHRVSIHARPRMAARPTASRRDTSRRMVSIHARPRMAARRIRACVTAPSCSFQSTRDHEWPRDRDARARRAMRPVLFQSTRDHEWPRDPSTAMLRTRSSFNPRATTNGRATCIPDARPDTVSMFQSTRDHEWPRDRALCGVTKLESFQSTRDHEWPRDIPALSLYQRRRSFNPRATTNGRATTGCTGSPDDRLFQSTRDHEWPRDRHPARTPPPSCFNPRATTNGRATSAVRGLIA